LLRIGVNVSRGSRVISLDVSNISERILRRPVSTRQHGTSTFPRRPAKRPSRPIVVRPARSYWWYFFLVGLPILAVGAGGAALWVHQDDWPLPWLDQIQVATTGAETDKARLTPNLSFRNSSGPIDQPLELGIALNNGTGAEILVLSGLSPGTSLSAGAPLSATRWSLPAPDVDNAFISAPTNFRGTMPVTATLYSSAHDILETREIRFEWSVAEAENGPADTDLTGVSGSVPTHDADGAQQARLSDAFGSVTRTNEAPPATTANSEPSTQAPNPTWLTMIADWLSQISSTSLPRVDQPFEPSPAPQSSPAPTPPVRAERSSSSLNRARPGAEEPRREQMGR
jgi:hypothetical protein